MASRPTAFLDIGIGDLSAHAKLEQDYARSREFCAKFGPMYGLPGDITAVSADDQETLADAFSSNPEWANRGGLLFQDPGSAVAGRVVAELFRDTCPKAVENFLCLCTGERGAGKASKKPLHYKGVAFHRIVRGFCCQGGDVVKGDGSGGDSIHGGKFNDEKAGLKLRHDGAGVLSMANSGKNTNSSQFFFTLAAAPQCDGKHVVFGRVLEGIEVLKRIDAEAASDDGAPKVPVTIVDCGVLAR
eukprot:jgi/Ulvmu1/8177/UM040_0074.1